MKSYLIQYIALKFQIKTMYNKKFFNHYKRRRKCEEEKWFSSKRFANLKSFWQFFAETFGIPCAKTKNGINHMQPVVGDRYARPLNDGCYVRSLTFTLFCTRRISANRLHQFKIQARGDCLLIINFTFLLTCQLNIYPNKFLVVASMSLRLCWLDRFRFFILLYFFLVLLLKHEHAIGYAHRWIPLNRRFFMCLQLIC